MPGDYNHTHNLIINTAKNLFLNNNYESISLREICKKSNITTGGFYRHFNDKHDLYCCIVKPVVDSLCLTFKNANNYELKVIESKNFDEIWSSDEKLFAEISNIIFSNYIEAKILINNSRGTDFENFIETIAINQAQNAIVLLKKASSLGLKINKIDKDEIIILAISQVSTIAKIFTSNIDKEIALKYAINSNKFFSAGWKALIFD